MTASTTTTTAESGGTPGPSHRPMSDGDYSYDPTDYPDDRSFENRMAELDFRDALGALGIRFDGSLTIAPCRDCGADIEWAFGPDDEWTPEELVGSRCSACEERAYFDDIPWGEMPDDETIKRLRPNVVRVGRAA